MTGMIEEGVSLVIAICHFITPRFIFLYQSTSNTESTLKHSLIVVRLTVSGIIIVQFLNFVQRKSSDTTNKRIKSQRNLKLRFFSIRLSTYRSVDTNIFSPCNYLLKSISCFKRMA